MKTTWLVGLLMALIVWGGAPHAGAASALPAWDFATTLAPWQINQDLSDVHVTSGVLELNATGTDGFILNRDLEFATTPWQYVLFRIKADRSGTIELFWSGSLTGANGGLSQDKSKTITILGDNQWHTYAIFPGWQAEGAIRQLRFDFYVDTHFSLDTLAVQSWGDSAAPLTDRYTFEFNGNVDAWRIHPEVNTLMAPPLALPVATHGWVAVEARSTVPRSAALLWAGEGVAGLQRKAFTLKSDGKTHVYNFELQGDSTWKDPLRVLGLEWPSATAEQLTLNAVTITTAPLGPPELVCDYFGFENAINRPGRTCNVLARITNVGSDSGAFKANLTLPAGLRSADGQLSRPVRSLTYGSVEYVTWPVIAESDAPATLTLSATLSDGSDAGLNQKAALAFDLPLTMDKADYVPAPRPIETTHEVCQYYFPGWNAGSKWEPIRRVAPIRKPVLGYYDEANPECVDWQIKWARENGISCFLLDWYWLQGSQSLNHWLQAYRQARYRDQLKIAIMWANHNPAGTHSREDWRNVTQWWIDNVFNLPAYQQVNGKPAVYLWYPDGARNDMGGTDEFKAAIAESQTMAQKAGYAGITFIAVNNDVTPTQVAQLAAEGFYGATNYHEFGDAPALAPSQLEVKYSDLVATVPAVWEKRQAEQDGLVYFPLVDSGWDARPWHGSNTMVMSGRTPELWETLLRAQKTFLAAHPKPLVIMGPTNEWGEGSYLEPNLEFGFKMYEKVREVFGKGDPASWPQNFAPVDVGLGPYDLKEIAVVPNWTFDKDAGSWNLMMGISNWRVEEGELRFTTTNGDNAMSVSTPGMDAGRYPAVEIKMQVIGDLGTGANGQLFWSRDGETMSEACSKHIALATDGQMHTYTLDLSTSPLWRSMITSLRFDPTAKAGVEVHIDSIRFISADTGAKASALYQ